MAEEDSEGDYAVSGSDEIRSISTLDQSSNASASRARRRYRRPTQNGTQGYLSNEYRNLLNVEIDALYRRARSADFNSSQIGASRWTSREKEALFQCLSLRGSDNLAALAHATRTKSEQEVRVYLTLLQDAACARASKKIDPRTQTASLHAGMPAAIEISAECERALDLAADALAQHVEEHASQQERGKVGNSWLVDEDEAERMDLSHIQSEPLTDLDANLALETDGKVPEETHEASTSDTGVTALLRPSSFLQLSRDVFMNNGEVDDLNWHHVDCISADSTRPAIFRTALEDFHNITVSIIRRVVQATIFQATSRLRAEDASRKDWTPLGVIREVDVRTAADLLGLPHDGRKYWATVPRRCKIGVYSASKKFADGRPSTKNGCLLTYDEVETEMGLSNAEVSLRRQELGAVSLDEDEIDDVMENSDLFTEDESGVPSAVIMMEQGGEVPTQVTKKRKRALSPNTFHRAEVDHMEAIDKAASAVEERRLWDLLRLDPPGDIATDHPVSVNLLPARPLTHGIPANWRTNVDYQAEWEQPNGVPNSKRFQDVESVGMAAKVKREALLEKVRVRLQSDRDQGSIEGHNTNDEGGLKSSWSSANSDSEGSG